MRSKNDSDSTFCSEVEELLRGQSSIKNLPVRRSQRLSQRLQKALQNTFKCGVGKCEQVLPEWKDVPLDLSRKPKVSRMKTPQDGNAALRFSKNEHLRMKNSLEAAKDDLKECAISWKKQNENNKCQRKKISFNKGSPDKNAKKKGNKSPKNAGIRCPNQKQPVNKSLNAKNISSTIKSSETETCEKERFDKQSIVVRENNFGNIFNASNANDVKIKSKLHINKIGSQTTSSIKCSIDKMDFSQILTTESTPHFGENWNYLKENSQSALKTATRLDISFMNKQSNKAKPATRGWKSEWKSKTRTENDSQNALETESKVDMNLWDKGSNNEKSSKRVRKRKQDSESQYNKKLRNNCHVQKATSEDRILLGNLRKQSKTFNAEKNEKVCNEVPSNSRLNINPIANEINSAWALQSQTVPLNTKNIDVTSQKVEINATHFEIECEKIKKEKLSQKPCDEEIGKVSNNVKSTKRGRKRKQNSDSQFNRKCQNTCHIQKYPSDERITLDTLQKLSKSFHAEKTEKVCSEAPSNSILKILPTSNEINSHRVLRSQKALLNKKNSDERSQKVGINDTHFEIEGEQIKKENLSQKPCEKEIETNKSRTTIQQYGEDKLSIDRFKRENLGTESSIKTTNLLSKAQKPLNSLKKLEQTKENFLTQTKIASKIPNSNKNYLKSFDKNRFLEKIQNSQSSENKPSFENIGFKKINTFDVPPTPAESSEELLKKSILHNTYPAHFKHQLPPEAILTRSLDPQPPLTPDDTISLELLNSSSSSPSLPESLCEIFKNKDIKDILNVKLTTYHLNRYHIQALALILNLRLEYLLKILDKIIDTSPTVLKNIDKAVKKPFVTDSDLFSTSPDELWDGSNIVPNSQSPQQRIISKTAG